MNISKIKEIVNDSLTSDIDKQQFIIQEIAKSEDAILNVLMILTVERKQKKELVSELNVLLSQAHVMLEEPKLNKGNFMQEKITEFYKEYDINHCFKDDL